jgi:hypothetical protein
MRQTDSLYSLSLGNEMLEFRSGERGKKVRRSQNTLTTNHFCVVESGTVDRLRFQGLPCLLNLHRTSSLGVKL